MYRLIKDLFKLLTSNQRKKLYILQVLVIAMVFAEIVGIASVAPFMALVGDVTVLDGDNILAKIYAYSEMKNQYDFVFFVGLAVLVALTLSAILSMLTTWKLAMFAAEVGTENADRLYEYYLNKNWLFHAGGSSSQLVKKIANEAVRVTDLVILPLILMIAKIVLVLSLLIVIVLLDPVVAFCGLLIFGIAYIILYVLVRRRLSKNGEVLSEVATVRFRLMNEAFGGIKDVLLLDRKKYFIDQFESSGKEFAYARGNNHVLWQVPRYLMELLAFGALIVLILYLIRTHNGNMGSVLPIITVYAFAAFKLLPAFQQIYSSLGQIRGNIAAFDAIRDDLQESLKYSRTNTYKARKHNKLIPKSEINISNIMFTYPGKTNPTLNKLTINLKANTVIGIVGPSGSGKSTLVDILLGLIKPQHGELKIDGVVVEDENVRDWQNSIGFVAQSIYLTEGTIAENIAFGIPEKEIDNKKVKRALTLAHLDEFIHSLDFGVNTKVGERGVQLSGGQRQRIAIARALYHEASVLIFDEATSALDGITEKIIMDAIHDFSGQKTIVMIAHRLKTIAHCDEIFYIDAGNVLAQGTYKELLNNNENFKKMASHS